MGTSSRVCFCVQGQGLGLSVVETVSWCWLFFFGEYASAQTSAHARTLCFVLLFYSFCLLLRPFYCFCAVRLHMNVGTRCWRNARVAKPDNGVSIDSRKLGVKFDGNSAHISFYQRNEGSYPITPHSHTITILFRSSCYHKQMAVWTTTSTSLCFKKLRKQTRMEKSSTKVDIPFALLSSLPLCSLLLSHVYSLRPDWFVILQSLH